MTCWTIWRRRWQTPTARDWPHLRSVFCAVRSSWWTATTRCWSWVCLVLDEEAEEYLELINPEIIAQSGEQTGLEGCLSVPGKWGIVTRPNRVRVRAQDRDGNWFEAEAEGLTARAFCHEIDHLDGRLYTELVSEYLPAAGEEEEAQA